jgi:predicted NUDIX family NTP pyrophosphohydrolase
MIQKVSAGLLMYRCTGGDLEVLLAHPGGPYWESRHKGAWTLPKGGIDAGEQPLEAAIREFVEETGFEPAGPYLPLGYVIQRSGKIVHAWAFEGDCDPSCLCSEMTTMEWPPRSGRHIEVPEVDQVDFFGFEAAHVAINVAQGEFLDRLVGLVADRPAAPVR